MQYDSFFFLKQTTNIGLCGALFPSRDFSVLGLFMTKF